MPQTLEVPTRRPAMEALRVAHGPCALGWVAIAAGDAGLRAVVLADSAREVLAATAQALPAAWLDDADAPARGLLTLVQQHVERPWQHFEGEVDVRGTPFQQRVWRALGAIPAGTTATYGELAASLGLPHGARAVGGACAANLLAVVIPCHRAIASNGRLTGFRWGIERKRALLALEAAGVRG